MAIVRWDPFRNLTTLQERINRLFEDSFPYLEGDKPGMCAWTPPVDIYDADDAIIIHAELPAIRKDDITIEIKDNVLTLKGERFPNTDVKEEKYYRRERCVGKFHRAFSLPAPLDPHNTKATFKNGVLEIEIRKPAEKKPKKISIAIK